MRKGSTVSVFDLLAAPKGAILVCGIFRIIELPESGAIRTIDIHDVPTIPFVPLNKGPTAIFNLVVGETNDASAAQGANE